MRLLLDTHTIVWWLLGDQRLSPAARGAILLAREVLGSAASAWSLRPICAVRHGPACGNLPTLTDV